MTDHKKRLFDRDTLSMVVAVCAVIISGASFYASYVQSEAALKQVQAETWPYLQIAHSNYSEDIDGNSLRFVVVNSGVGPAKFRTLQYYYKGVPVNGFGALYDLCCLSDEEKSGQKERGLNNVITGTAPPVILLPHDDLLFFSSIETPENTEVWKRVDAARWHITAEGCYCSLLDECYETDFVNDPIPVKVCTPQRANR